MLSISVQPIDIEMLLENVKDEGAGATVLFLGTVRNQSEGYAVSAIYYEAYVRMAEEPWPKSKQSPQEMEFEKSLLPAQNWQVKDRRS